MQFPTFAILALVVALVQAAPQGYTGTSDHEVSLLFIFLSSLEPISNTST